MRKPGSLHLSVIMLLALSPAALCQFSSNVQGIVEDPSSARVPGASINLRNLDTGVTSQAKSNESGYYRFNSLQPGNYELSVEANGFQTKKVTAALLTGTTTDLNLTLALTSATQTVQVTERAALLDTAETKIQVVLGAGRIPAARQRDMVDTWIESMLEGRAGRTEASVARAG